MKNKQDRAQGDAAGFAGQAQLLYQLLEWQVLMDEVVEHRLPYAGEHFAKAGIARQVSPYRQVIDKEADE